MNYPAKPTHGFKSLISPQLDDVIAFASSEKHPLRQMILDRAVSLGFSAEEAGWLFKELEAIKYRPVQLLCADGFEDLDALLSGISVGEGGLLLAGFARFTDNRDHGSRRCVTFAKVGEVTSQALSLPVTLDSFR